MTQEAELGLRDRLAQLSGVKLLRGTRLSAELERLQRQLERLREDTTDEEIWRSVELARNEKRPYTLDYVERILDDWFELHGSVDYEGVVADLPALLAAARRGESFVRLGDGTFGVMPADWLAQNERIAALGTADGDHVRFASSQVALLDAWLSNAHSASSALTLSVVAALALAVRRRHPYAVFALTVPALFSGYVLIAPLTALYTVASVTRSRWPIAACSSTDQTW